MDDIFENIDSIGAMLDKAKSFDISRAADANAIVLSCIDSLKAVSGQLKKIKQPAADPSLQDGDTSL